MHEALFSSALGAAPTLLIALVLEVRGIQFHDDAPRWGRGLIRSLMWIGFIGCAAAGWASARALANLDAGWGTARIVEYGLMSGLFAVVFVGGLKLAWSPLGGLAPMIARDQEELTRKANSRRIRKLRRQQNGSRAG